MTSAEYMNGMIDTLDDINNIIMESLARHGTTSVQGVCEAMTNIQIYLDEKSLEVQEIAEALMSPQAIRPSRPHLYLVVDNTNQGGM